MRETPKSFIMMGKNNLLVGIAILLATTACAQGGYLGIGGEDIARTAERHEGSTDWALNKKKDDFNPGNYKCNKFVYDVLRETGATAPKKPDGIWPLQAADWANPNFRIFNWMYLGTGEPWQRGDVIATRRHTDNTTGHCGAAVSNSSIMAASDDRVKKQPLGGGAVRRYTGS